jgi:hypothetical protein
MGLRRKSGLWLNSSVGMDSPWISLIKMKHSSITPQNVRRSKVSSENCRSRSLTSCYIVKRRPQPSAHQKGDEASKLFQSIGQVLHKSAASSQQKQLLSTLALEDTFVLARLEQQHRVLHVSARSDMKPNPQPPSIAQISSRLSEYQQLLNKIKQTRSKRIKQGRPATPPLEMLGVDCYYLDLIQTGGTSNNKIRSIAIRK